MMNRRAAFLLSALSAALCGLAGMHLVSAADEAPLKFTQPIPFGPYPVNGNTIEQLAHSTPMFPPIEGLDEKLWKKNCTTCHKWDQQQLCEQGAGYAKTPANVLRTQHPFGGAYKLALMQWAKSGCQ
jgi:hypothetical protein